MAYEFKVENKFILDAELKAENSQLKRALKDAQEGARDLEQSLRNVRDEYEELQSEFERFKSGTGIQEMQERLERFERSANRSAAAYRSFLESVNLKYTGRGGFFGLTDAEEDIKRQLDKIKADIESGVLSLPDAITKVKLNFGHLFEENHAKTGSAMDPAVYEGIANALTALGSKLDTVLQKFETFGTGGGAATGAKATVENLQQIGDAAEQMMNSFGNSGEFTKQLIDHLANINQVANTVSDTLTGMSALIQQINEKSLGTNLNLTMANDSQRAISIVKQQVLDYADAIIQAQQELARLSKSDAWAQIAPRGSELSRALGQVTASLMRFDLGSITKGLQSNFVQSAGAINKYVEQVKSYANIILPFMERIKEAGVTTFDTTKLTAPVITDEGIQKLQTEQSSAAQAINQIVSSLGQEAKAVSDTDARYAEHAKAISDAANAERQKMEASRELSVALLDELRHLQEIAKAAKADTGDDWHSRMLVAAEGIHSATKSLNEYTTASKEAAQAQKEFKEGASVKTASGNDGAVETAQKLTQEIHNEQDAVRQADAEYQSHISSVEAAAKAEERKIKASELLADAMKSEESATDKATEAANRHQTAVDNQNASNDKEEQRMQRLAAAEAEYYAKQERARADAEAKKQAQIDSEVAKHNAALDKEEAAVEAATKREIEAWDRAEKAKIASVEKAAAAAAAAEQKAADAAQKATYNDARRAVNKYYGLLTSKDTSTAKREDVVMTEAGWASQSGKYAELAQQLNDAKTAYDLFTGAQKESMMSGEQIAAINELIATRQKDYALAVENTAAKEAEHAQRSAELAQKKQAEAEAANAAKEAKKQEAEATKAQAQAERDAAKASKEAEQNANRKKNYITQLNNLLVKCEGAERKYAAASKLSNARDNYEGIQRTKEEVQKLLVELEKESPDLDRVAAGLRNCTTEYSKNSTALQTNTSLAGRWVTNGMQQLKSRLQYSFGLAAMVYKAVGEVKKMVTTAVELDSAMNTLQIVTRASGEEMDEYGKRVSSMAKETAQATKDLIDATTVYARLGYSMDESAILSKYTAMLQGVGNIDASAAQDAITAIVKAFNIGVNDIETAMDKMVVVGNNFPISVSQIAEGMNNAGSMLAVAGNSFEESIALLTAANTTIQNISKASTGLRTIAARIRKTTTGEDGDEIVEESKYNDMINALTKHKVTITDINGEYRSTYDIIKDIAAVWDDMTSMEQAAVTEALAGTRQQNIFTSLMTQFGGAEDAMERMKNSAGELQEAFDIRLESIESHVQQLKSAFDRLSMDFVNSEFAKKVVDAGTKIIEIIEKLVSNLGVLGTVITTIGSTILIRALRSGAFVASIKGVGQAIAGVLTTIKTVAPELLLVAAAVAAVTFAVKKLKEANPSTEDLSAAASKAKADAEAAQKAYEDTADAIKENQKRIKALQDLATNGEITENQEKELEKLLEQNTEYERQIALLERKAELAAKSAKEAQKEAAYAQFNGIFGDKSTKSVSFLPGGWDRAGGDARVVLGGTVPETHDIKQRVNELIGSYNYSLLEVGAISNTINERLKSDSEEVKESADALIDDLDIAETKLSQTEEAVRQQYLELSTLREQFDGLDDPKSMAMVEQIDELLDIIDKALPKSDKSLQGFKHNFELLDKTIRDKFSKGIHELTDREMKDFDRWMKQCGYTADDLSKNLADWINELNGEPSGFVNTTWQNIDSLTSFRDELSKTKAALEDYNKAMEGGEKGDDIASMQEIYKGALEDIQAGKIDSNRMHAAAQLLFSSEQLTAMGNDLTKVAQAINSDVMRALFDPEGSDELDYGQRFVKYVRDHFSEEQGVWTDGNLFFYDSLSDVARAFGMSEAACAAFIDSLDAYGVSVMRSNEENTELVRQFNEIRNSAEVAGNTVAAVEQFIRKLHDAGRDRFDTYSILSDLQASGQINMDTAQLDATFEAVWRELEDLDKTKAEATGDLNVNPALENLRTLETAIASVIHDYYATVYLRTVRTSDSGPSQHSTSTRGAAAGGKSAGQRGGSTLVNELGPELISDDGRAFIANGGHPGFVNLSKNAIVFTADETEDILHGRRTVRAKARAEGTGTAGLRERLLKGGRTPARAGKVCPNCGKKVNSWAKTCRHCGYDFAQAEVEARNDPQSTTQTLISDPWQCAWCGNWNLGSDYWCQTCGATKDGGSPEYGNNEPAPVYEPEPQTYDPGWTCPYCKTWNSSIYSVCNACGKDPRTYRPDLEKSAQTPQKTVNVGHGFNITTPTSTGGNGYVGSGGGNYVGGADYASTSDPQKVDWIAVRINRLQRTIADLEKVASSGFKKLDVRLLAAREQIDETTAEIDVMNKGYERYMKEAASVGLDAGIAERVQNGTIDITEYDDETRKKIDEYTEW